MRARSAFELHANNVRESDAPRRMTSCANRSDVLVLALPHGGVRVLSEDVGQLPSLTAGTCEEFRNEFPQVSDGEVRALLERSSREPVDRAR